MATKGERQALFFLVGIVLLGAGTRACRARGAPPPQTATLDQQISAVESPPSRGKSRKAGRARGLAKRDSAGPTAISAQPEGQTQSPLALPARVRRVPKRHAASISAAQRVDVDRASAAEIDGLPGVGPSLAKRIVANRDSAGAFGCFAALRQVRGVGPSLLQRFDALVTFSGAPRAICVQR